MLKIVEVHQQNSYGWITPRSEARTFNSFEDFLKANEKNGFLGYYKEVNLRDGRIIGVPCFRTPFYRNDIWGCTVNDELISLQD